MTGHVEIMKLAVAVIITMSIIVVVDIVVVVVVVVVKFLLDVFLVCFSCKSPREF